MARRPLSHSPPSLLPAPRSDGFRSRLRLPPGEPQFSPTSGSTSGSPAMLWSLAPTSSSGRRPGSKVMQWRSVAIFASRKARWSHGTWLRSLVEPRCRRVPTSAAGCCAFRRWPLSSQLRLLREIVSPNRCLDAPLGGGGMAAGDHRSRVSLPDQDAFRSMGGALSRNQGSGSRDDGRIDSFRVLDRGPRSRPRPGCTSCRRVDGGFFRRQGCGPHCPRLLDRGDGAQTVGPLIRFPSASRYLSASSFCLL